MSDKVIAWIKTVVPGAWGALIAYIVTQVALPQSLQDYLTDPLTITLVVGASVALWKIVWDKVDDYIPDWLSRIVLGSAQQAVYPERTITTGAVGVTTVLEPENPSEDELLYDGE